MAANSNIRLRIITLINIFLLYTDEDNLLSMAELCEKLSEYGFNVDRRAVLSDIKVLNQGDFEVVCTNKPKRGYYMVPHTDLNVIYLMLKAIYTSDLISNEDCKAIISQQRRHMCQSTADFIFDTYFVATRRDNTYRLRREFAADLGRAIKDKKAISIILKSFEPGDSYSGCNVEKELKVNPHTLVVNMRAIMLAFTKVGSEKTLYCVDISRIKTLSILKKDAQLLENPDYINSLNYFTGKRIMSGTPAIWMYLKCKNESLESVSEYFGENLQVKKSETDDCFMAKIYTHKNYALLGWLAKNRHNVRVVEPEDIRKRVEEIIKY